MKKIFFIFSLFPILALAQSQDQNYIKTTTYKAAGASSPVVQVIYFDGLGRPIQKIAHAQSATGKDIVTPMEYDGFGRQEKEFLPYANTTASLNYNASAATDVLGFYNTTAYENTANPYSQKLFENSPQNRVVKQAAPGTSWAMGSGHEIKLDVQTNAVNEVKRLTATTSWSTGKGLYEIAIADNTYYTTGTLYKTVTKDENWTSGNNNTTQEFKNKNGQVVLKRTFNDNTAYDTYYVYDKRGNLTYVIPPLADGAITTTVLDGLCYQYKYDYKNRLAAKKLPGKQWEYIVYDRLDRPVATGPAFSPFGDSTTGMTITEYDAFGRVTQTGWKAMTVTESNRNTWQGNINSGSNPFALATNDILSKNYYDNYGFPDTPTPPSTVEGQEVATAVKGMATGSWVRVMTTAGEQKGETTCTLYDTKYRPIRSYTANHLGGYTQTDSKLDFIGKTLYTKTYHKRILADAEIVITDTFTYSAQDRLLLHTQQIGSGAAQLIAGNTYDELGQLTSKNVGGTDVTGALGLQKVDYTYNIRGWLKGINDTANLAQGTDPQDLFAFRLNYQDNSDVSNGTYLVPKLYNGNISEAYWRTNSDNVLRKYGFNYDNLNRLTQAVYQKPSLATPTTSSYNEGISYDKNGNITGLIRTGEYDDAVYQMEIDNLTYNYDTNTGNLNRLMKASDSTNNPNGFKDDAVPGQDMGDDYAYDANGNMIADENKGITAIAYNHLNLPTKITFGNDPNVKIEYLYNAAGQKLQKKVTNGTFVNTTEYLGGGFQYFDTVLEMFPQAEGYVKNTVVNGTNVYNYAFNYTDHLGNVRLTYGVDPVTQTVKIMEESNYYPFGLKHANYNMTQRTYYKTGPGSVGMQPPCMNCPLSFRYNYKYNGKELQDELGLNMYDYGARNYDPAIGRWMNIDPLAENSRRWTLYNYTYNNPMYFVDPDGMQSDDWKKTAEGNYVYDSGLTRENASSRLGEGETYFGKSGKVSVVATDTYGNKETKSEYGLNENGSVTDKSTGATTNSGADIQLGSTGKSIVMQAPNINGITKDYFNPLFHDLDGNGRLDSFSVGDQLITPDRDFLGLNQKSNTYSPSEEEDFAFGEIFGNLAEKVFGKAGSLLLDTQGTNVYEKQKSEHDFKVNQRRGDSIHLRGQAIQYLKTNKLPLPK